MPWAVQNGKKQSQPWILNTWQPFNESLRHRVIEICRHNQILVSFLHWNFQMIFTHEIVNKCLGIRIDSEFNVDNANKYGRNFNKDSPCRWLSIICPSRSRTGGNHGYLNKTMNSNAREKRFASLNKTFRNEEIIATYLR